MAVKLFFNELSLHPVAPAREVAIDRVRQLVTTVRAFCNQGFLRQIIFQASFPDALLADGYPCRKFVNDKTVPKEMRFYFLSLITKSPHLEDTMDVQERALEVACSFDGEACKGLEAAFLTDNLAISLPSEATWDPPFLALKIQELQDNGNLQDRQGHVHHASQPEHIQQDHKTWLQTVLKGSVTTGNELWEASASYFPSLRFCDAVQDQMRRLPRAKIPSFFRGLLCLETYCTQWQSGGFNQNALGCASSSEGQTATQQFADERTFVCPDGMARTFAYHVKLGNPWRIYYDVSPGPGTMYIGFLGDHLRNRHDH